MVVEKIYFRYVGEHSQRQEYLGQSSEHDQVEFGNVERERRVGRWKRGEPGTAARNSKI